MLERTVPNPLNSFGFRIAQERRDTSLNQAKKPFVLPGILLHFFT
jgi:hypothetical protein